MFLLGLGTDNTAGQENREQIYMFFRNQLVLAFKPGNQNCWIISLDE